jgi:pimeloyl-ACP methyl ester carboxylesterase
VGHSFGGKVALALLARRPPALEDVLLLDSNPGASLTRDASVEQVLLVLSALSFPFPSQQAFWDAAGAGGLPPSIAKWLGMSLEHRGDGYYFGPSLSDLRALYEDYLRQDLWPVLDPPPAPVQVGVLLGGRSILLGELEPRFERLAREHQNLRLRILPGAGHWVHVDDPDGTFQFVNGALARHEG